MSFSLPADVLFGCPIDVEKTREDQGPWFVLNRDYIWLQHGSGKQRGPLRTEEASLLLGLLGRRSGTLLAGLGSFRFAWRWQFNFLSC